MDLWNSGIAKLRNRGIGELCIWGFVQLWNCGCRNGEVFCGSLELGSCGDPELWEL